MQYAGAFGVVQGDTIEVRTKQVNERFKEEWLSTWKAHIKRGV